MKNMNKINIAIIDSGINSTSILKSYNISCCYSCNNNNFDDEVGHGTNVMRTILFHENRVNIFVFKIFEDQLICKLQELLAVLKKIYLEYPQINIINMSLGVSEDNPQLRLYCKKLSERGVKLIAAYNNKTQLRTFPAEYPFVFGVRAELYYNSFEYSISHENNVKIYGYLPYLLVKESHITCQANSFAAAHFTGIMAKELLEGNVKKNISNYEFEQYKKEIGDCSWLKKVIIIDESINSNLPKYKKKKIIPVGICKIGRDGKYYISYYEKNINYDSLVVDEYDLKYKNTVLDFVISNMQKGKNIFSVTGFGTEYNTLLYKLAKKFHCKLFIKYNC